MVVTESENQNDNIVVTIRGYNGMDITYEIPQEGKAEIWKTEYAKGDKKGLISKIQLTLEYEDGIDEMITTLK